MNATRLNKELEEYIGDNVVHYKEYQNKYFLKKKIKEILPDKSDDFIYQAIEYANKEIKSTKKRKDYIKLLLEKNKLSFEDLVKKMSPYYDDLKAPIKALIKDTNDLSNLGALKIQKIDKNRYTISIRLEISFFC